MISFIKSRSLLRMAFYFLLVKVIGIFLSFLAAPILRVLFQNSSKLFYWALLLPWLALVSQPSTFLVSILMIILWVGVGIFGTLEGRFVQRPYALALFASLLAVGATGLLALGITSLQGLSLLDLINHTLEPLVAAQAGALKEVKLNLKGLVPGVLVFVSLSNLVFALALDRKFALVFKLPFRVFITHPRLLDFRAPDALIWVFLLGFLGSFLRQIPEPLQLACTNLVIVAGGVYFFQGLAVLESLLYAIRAGLLIRILVYVLLVGQMFLILVGLGLTDYWVDLRSKFGKWFKFKG